MQKRFDIKGYWNTGEGNVFPMENRWEGHIILEEDAWFEGIVIDPSNPAAGDMFVFGIYYPDQVIELLKLAKASISGPFVFRGNKEENGYNGKFSAIKLFGEEPYGNTHITTEEALSIEDDEEKWEDLQERMDNFKKYNDYKDLYTSTFKMKRQMAELVLRKHLGKGFCPAEAIALLAEMQDILDQEDENRMGVIKQFIKRKKKDNE